MPLRFVAPSAGNAGLGALGGGHGIVGMRERVGLYGGSVQAEPGEHGGFAVQARLPIATAVTA